MFRRPCKLGPCHTESPRLLATFTYKNPNQDSWDSKPVQSSSHTSLDWFHRQGCRDDSDSGPASTSWVWSNLSISSSYYEVTGQRSRLQLDPELLFSHPSLVISLAAGWGAHLFLSSFIVLRPFILFVFYSISSSTSCFYPKELNVPVYVSYLLYRCIF